jgi:hypothetical protein
MAVLLLAVVLSTGCSSPPRPQYTGESPAGSGNWVPIAGEPAWVAAPPKEKGVLRFVASNQSNLRSIIFDLGGPFAETEAMTEVRARLIPAGGEAMEAALAAIPGNLRLLERACRKEVLTTDPVPGNTLCTGWALWELPLDPVVDALPEEWRAWGREALER